MTIKFRRKKGGAKKVIWKAIPNTFQEIMLLSGQPEYLVRSVLAHSGRGTGKSLLLILCFLQMIGKGWGSHWSGIVLRREIKPLRDLIQKSFEIIPKAFPDAVYNKTLRYWEFGTGERLYFDFCKDLNDYETKHHGGSWAFIGFDELSTWQDDTVYEAMQSLLRSGYIPTPEQPNMPPLQIRSTTNPYGRGKGWVKEKFIDAAQPGEILRNKDGKAMQMHLYGSVYENIYLSPGYIEDYLEAIADPVLRAAWLYGDWHSVDYSAIFGGMWSSYVEMDPFDIPHSWQVHRCFDYGTASPFACLWVAEANGEEIVLKDGTVFNPPAGSLIVVAEDYGTEEKDGKQVRRNLGLNLSARNIARRLKEKEKRLSGGLLKNTKILPGPADNQIYNGQKIDKGKSPTVAKEMEQEGIKFINSDKSPGSRSNSAQIMIERLDATRHQDPERPHVYIFKTCKYTLKYLPELSRDEDKPEEVAKGADDHIWDALAYRLTMRKRGRMTGANPF